MSIITKIDILIRFIECQMFLTLSLNNVVVLTLSKMFTDKINMYRCALAFTF